MHIQNHWLSPATHIQSPNYDERPNPEDISLVVIHCISLPPGEFGTPCISQLFCNGLNPEEHPYFQEIYQLKVSSHLLIRRDGELVQYVPFDKRAWHAGQSSYAGRERCNDFSIGIELEGTETTVYTESQYHQLANVVVTLISTYPGLSSDRITGHSDISPGRKTDPGESFDWDKLYCFLKKTR
jgi:N-acetyl-anhydromuramoyl-L-alanine amidase